MFKKHTKLLNIVLNFFSYFIRFPHCMPWYFNIEFNIIQSENMLWLIESTTTLWKGQGNPIRVSMICNPWRGLPSRGCYKSWTRGWDSLVPSTMWWLIIFLPRLLILVNNTISTSFKLYKAQRHGTAPYGNVMLFVTSWRHNILGAKWRRKNVVSP